MIAFCEDCGEKNNLLSGLSHNGKAIFTCNGCGYKNAYKLKSFTGIEKTAARLKKELADYPFIIGSFIFHPQRKTHYNTMPKTVSSKDIDVLGILLEQNLRLGSSLFQDIQHLTVNIADKQLFAIGNAQSYFFVLVTKDQGLSRGLKTKISQIFSHDMNA